MNVCMAKAYLAGKSPQLTTRTWDVVMVALNKCGGESTQERCARAMKSEPFSVLRKIPLIETDAQLFLDVLNHSARVLQDRLPAIEIDTSIPWSVVPPITPQPLEPGNGSSI